MLSPRLIAKAVHLVSSKNWICVSDVPNPGAFRHVSCARCLYVDGPSHIFSVQQMLKDDLANGKDERRGPISAYAGEALLIMEDCQN